MLNLTCDCKFHKLTVEKIKLSCADDLYSILIYQHKSFDTGKLLKNPKLLADVVLTTKQYKLFRKYNG